MGALPHSEPVSVRYAEYIEELHEFLDTYNLPHGSPDDVYPVAEKLHATGPFPGDLSLVIRSILHSEGGAMPRAELLQLISVAVGGPEMEHASRDYELPLRHIFSFLNTVRRRPLTVPGEGGQLIPFPSSTFTGAGEADSEPFARLDSASQPQMRLDVSLSDPLAEPPVESESGAMEQPAVPSAGPLAPSFRNLLIAAGVAILLAFVMVFILAPRHVQSRETTRPQINAPLSSVPKPSAYGEAFTPTRNIHAASTFSGYSRHIRTVKPKVAQAEAELSSAIESSSTQPLVSAEQTSTPALAAAPADAPAAPDTAQ